MYGDKGNDNGQPDAPLID